MTILSMPSDEKPFDSLVILLDGDVAIILGSHNSRYLVGLALSKLERDQTIERDLCRN